MLHTAILVLSNHIKHCSVKFVDNKAQIDAFYTRDICSTQSAINIYIDSPNHIKNSFCL